MTRDVWTQANRSRAALEPGNHGRDIEAWTQSPGRAAPVMRTEVRLTKFSEGAG